jgi:hypothetical protein
MASPSGTASEPAAVLLLPRTLEGFIQRDQALDLLRSPAVHAIEPAGIPYGAYLRLAPAAARALASVHARGIRLPGDVRVLTVFHPVQWPLAEALLKERCPKAELWYLVWDRYDHALDADERTRRRLGELHAAISDRARVVVTVSEALADIERDAGRKVTGISPSAADSFPDLDPTAGVVAVSLGRLGWRIDWRLLRRLCELMEEELTLLLIGKVDADQVEDDPDFLACRDRDEIVWLGFQPDAAAARLIACSDVALLPFKEEPFNDAGIPNRILKAARIGRRTIVPPLSGPQTWAEAIVVADGPRAWVEALRAERGARAETGSELRAWAFEQTAENSNAPLWDRMRRLGLPGPE